MARPSGRSIRNRWRPSRKRANGRPPWPLYAALVIGALAIVSPFVWQILTSFKSFGESTRVPPTILPTQWVLTSYQDVFATLPFWQMLLTTVIMALARTAGHLLFCSMAAYAFARLHFFGRDALFMLVLCVMMI